MRSSLVWGHFSVTFAPLVVVENCLLPSRSNQFQAALGLPLLSASHPFPHLQPHPRRPPLRSPTDLARA